VNRPSMSQRAFGAQGGTALAGLALLNSRWVGRSFALQADEEVIPWLVQPAENSVTPAVANQHTWEELDSCKVPAFNSRLGGRSPNNGQ
jgi:hypothetical protein